MALVLKTSVSAMAPSVRIRPFPLQIFYYIMEQSNISMQGALDRLKTIKGSSSRKIEIYSQRCFLDFKNNDVLEWWNSENEDKDVARAITRPFYDLVHSCSIPTGLITESAFASKVKNSKVPVTKDHCFRPQFVYRYMLDNYEKFQDYEVFRRWFIMCCSTIYVMGLENDRLSSGGTKNQGGKYEILSPTDQQYVRANLNLYSYSKERQWSERTITIRSNLIDAPESLLNYERKFISA